MRFVTFVTYSVSERLVLLILNCELFMKSDEWLEITKYQSEGDAFTLVCTAPPKSVTAVLNIVTRRLPGTVIFDLDKNGNPIRTSANSNVSASSLSTSPTVMY